jgi:O-acetyl-ADP-ribose deacetylase (regulator of RNase III)
MIIQYLEGDATAPGGDGQRIIVHVCNDIGKWGKGFVLALSRRWKEPEQAYKAAFQSSPTPKLGDVQFVRVTKTLTVANLIGQHGVASRVTTTPPVRYDAIRQGLAQVAARTKEEPASVHMPRIGCSLAGGEWAEVEPIVKETLTNEGIAVTVYDLAAGTHIPPRKRKPG